MDLEQAVGFLVEHASRVDVQLADIKGDVLAVKTDLAYVKADVTDLKTDVTDLKLRAGYTESKMDFLVEHAGRLDAEIEDLKRRAATKDEVNELSDAVRERTKVFMQYVGYVDLLLQTVTRGQLSLEEQMKKMRTDMDGLELRIADLEKRNPPQAA